MQHTLVVIPRLVNVFCYRGQLNGELRRDLVTQVAEKLGIGRATFYKWVKESEFRDEFKPLSRRGRGRR